MRINEAKSRFELEKNDLVVFADFERHGKALIIRYVESPPELRGTGAASELMQHIVNYARDEGFSINPVCSYAASWISRNTKNE